MDRLKDVGLYIFIVATILLVAGFAIKVHSRLPPDALVLANYDTGSYVTVPCVLRSDVQTPYVLNKDAVVAGTEDVIYELAVEATTVAVARKAGLTLDESCARTTSMAWETPLILSFLGLGEQHVLPDGTVLR